MKESSDQLSAAIVTDAVVVPVARRTFTDYLALAIGTCGVGFLPLAPGTWGSLVGVGLFLCVHWASLRLASADGKAENLGGLLRSFESSCLILLLLPLALAGVWAATRCESLLGRKDPGAVVIDEVIGQLLAYMLVPALVSSGDKLWPFIVVGFLAFRTFDIWKPYPIRRFEALESGLGIMADDLVAGIYALIVNSVLIGAYLLINALCG
jgi:phosphatidylglycerophosphatase A